MQAHAIIAPLQLSSPVQDPSGAMGPRPSAAASRMLLQHRQQPQVPVRARPAQAARALDAEASPSVAADAAPPAKQPQGVLQKVLALLSTLVPKPAAYQHYQPRPSTSLLAQTLKTQCLRQNDAAMWQQVVEEGYCLELGPYEAAIACDNVFSAHQPPRRISAAAPSSSSLVIVPRDEEHAWVPHPSRFAPSAAPRAELPLFIRGPAMPQQKPASRSRAAADSSIACRTRSKTAAAASSTDCIACRTRSKAAAAKPAAARQQKRSSSRRR